MNAKLAYRSFLKSETWQNIRLACLARDDAKCQICGLRDLKNDAHHIIYPAGGWANTTLEMLRTLCRKCHDKIHADGRRVGSISKMKLSRASWHYKRDSRQIKRGGHCPVCGLLARELKPIKEKNRHWEACQECYTAIHELAWTLIDPTLRLSVLRKAHKRVLDKKRDTRGKRIYGESLTPFNSDAITQNEIGVLVEFLGCPLPILHPALSRA